MIAIEAGSWLLRVLCTHVTNLGPWTLIEIDEARREIQARPYWGLCCSGGRENKSEVPLLAPCGGAGWSLKWDLGGAVA